VNAAPAVILARRIVPPHRTAAVAAIVKHFDPSSLPSRQGPDQAARGARLIREALETLTAVPVINARFRRTHLFVETGSLRNTTDYADRLVRSGIATSIKDSRNIAFASVQFVEGPDLVSGVRNLGRPTVGTRWYGPIAFVLDPESLGRATMVHGIGAGGPGAVGGSEHLPELLLTRLNERSGLATIFDMDDVTAVAKIRSFLLSDTYAQEPLEAHVRGLTLSDVRAVRIEGVGPNDVDRIDRVLPAAMQAARAARAPLIHRFDPGDATNVDWMVDELSRPPKFATPNLQAMGQHLDDSLRRARNTPVDISESELVSTLDDASATLVRNGPNEGLESAAWFADGLDDLEAWSHPDRVASAMQRLRSAVHWVRENPGIPGSIDESLAAVVALRDRQRDAIRQMREFAAPSLLDAADRLPGPINHTGGLAT
jgi:hypothetical protein